MDIKLRLISGFNKTNVCLKDCFFLSLSRGFMNIVLWILQILMAAHTLIGGLWKFSNPVAELPSLAVIPQWLWLAIGVLEIFFALGLILPLFKKSLGQIISVAALAIVAEMFLFTGLHLASGSNDKTQISYWLVVAAICGFISFARFKLKPIR